MINRKTVPMTPELRERWERARQETEAELPELLEQGRRMREASAEDTLSGALRRAIHQSARELADIAATAGITTLELNDFLTGERTLPSDVLDRLTQSLGLVLTPAETQ